MARPSSHLLTEQRVLRWLHDWLQDVGWEAHGNATAAIKKTQTRGHHQRDYRTLGADWAFPATRVEAKRRFSVSMRFSVDRDSLETVASGNQAQ